MHVGTYEVDARSAAEAIQRLLNGDGDMFNGSEFIGTCNEVGMTMESELAEQLRELGVKLRGTTLPSIREVQRIAEGSEER